METPEKRIQSMCIERGSSMLFKSHKYGNQLMEMFPDGFVRSGQLSRYPYERTPFRSKEEIRHLTSK